MTDEHTQLELAKERTHAAWLRTCLAYLVASVAYRHYVAGDTGVATVVIVGVLAGGAGLCALQALRSASNPTTVILAIGLIAASCVSAFIPIQSLT